MACAGATRRKVESMNRNESGVKWLNHSRRKLTGVPSRENLTEINPNMVGVAMAVPFVASRGHARFGQCPNPSRLARAMSRHASAALLAFASLQVWGMTALGHAPGGAVITIAAIAMLLLVALPFTRRLERRWHDLAGSALPSPGLTTRFRKDRTRLWLLALAVPPLWLGTVAVAAQAATGF